LKEEEPNPEDFIR
jgi:hypothetical protein